MTKPHSTASVVSRHPIHGVEEFDDLTERDAHTYAATDIGKVVSVDNGVDRVFYLIQNVVAGVGTFLEVPGSGGIQELLLETLVSQPLTALSLYKRLSGYYSGPLFRVRRDSDGGERDIFFGEDNLVNVAQLEDFCTGADGFVTKVYDQTNHGNHVFNVTSTKQPKIFDNSTGVQYLIDDAPAMLFDGTDDWLGRADALGMTGNQALTVAYVNDMVTIVNNGCVVAIGGSASSSAFTIRANGTDTDEWIVTNNSATQSSGAIADNRLVGYRVVDKDGSSGPSSWDFRDNGTDLTMTDTGSGSLNMVNSFFYIGIFPTEVIPSNMLMTTMLVWNHQLTTGDRDLVEDELALHVT